ncbi:hypothetical protein HIM_08241 [Hirsutella minnesotensis 3608]|uniref:D-isomer specific 2-hydroxyacid dehydrogenase NAD-binding domain-containing protein n=1 Tax=Hirsutella minnesotensis 3608 TaxID=1043627 RepID=A0A0F7ZMN6_9HYPO|nr:hypothetical protein HIM_08241 [Hirsutella minnesotensis 3608]
MAEPQNTPATGLTPRSASPAAAASSSGTKPRVLHLGDAIRFNPKTYEALAARYDVVRPSTPDRQRGRFKEALEQGKWGNFEAIFRPFWGTGGEMGPWDAELIDLLPAGVKVFASAGAGFDWVDTERLGKRGVLYCNGGSAPADAVADFAVAMIISTFRHLPWCMSAATSGSPSEFQECHIKAPAQSNNLRNQVLGIIGMGNIGQRIAARCRHGFGMKIHYFDVVRKGNEIEQPLAATFHDDLQSIVEASDCTVLCTPTGPGTGTVINASTLAHFRRGARFVNVARGSLVDEDDLVAALREERISAVALDVHAKEPHPHEGLKQFAAQGRAMLTCHNAGGTVQCHAEFEDLSMRNVMAVLSGGQALSPVNLHHLKG